MNINDIIILKDQEEKDLYYVCVKKKHDEEYEKTIIGSGASREEALTNSLNNVINAHKNCLQAVCEIGNIISYSDFYDLNEDFTIRSVEIKRASIEGGNFSQVCWDENTEQWYPLADGFFVVQG